MLVNRNTLSSLLGAMAVVTLACNASCGGDEDASFSLVGGNAVRSGANGQGSSPAAVALRSQLADTFVECGGSSGGRESTSRLLYIQFCDFGIAFVREKRLASFSVADFDSVEDSAGMWEPVMRGGQLAIDIRSYIFDGEQYLPGDSVRSLSVELRGGQLGGLDGLDLMNIEDESPECARHQESFALNAALANTHTRFEAGSEGVVEYLFCGDLSYGMRSAAGVEQGSWNVTDNGVELGLSLLATGAQRAQVISLGIDAQGTVLIGDIPALLQPVGRVGSPDQRLATCRSSLLRFGG